MLEFTAVSGRIATMQRPTDRNGFTLVELAVSLVVIGLLIGLGTAMVGPLMSAIKVRESRENLGAAVESINSWASSNNRLPDVAGGTSDFKGVVRTPADAWGRDFIYLYDCRFASTDSVACPGAAPAITKDTICGRRTTNITLTDHNTGASIQNVVYAVFSQSDDAAANSTFSACPPSGTAVSSGPRTATTPVCADTANDLVRWATLDELRTKVGCQGPQLRIVNNELPYGSLSSPYPDVYVVADGGLGSSNYQWCVETTSASAPATLAFRQNSATGAALLTIFSSNCSTHTTWGSATQLVVNGTPTIGGSHYFKIFVRDGATAAANNANKSFVLTINP